MKVLLVDDHPLILAALQGVIQGLGDHVVVQGAPSAEAARQALRAEAFDLVLLDLSLGEVDGFGVLAELRRTWPAIPVVVISASERPSDVIRAIDVGAMGYVPKRTSTETLCEALRLVMSGGLYVPPSMRGPDGFAPPAADIMVSADDAPAAPAPLPSPESIGLTPRQGEVLTLLLQGLSNKLIARQLNVSVETVKDHVAAVLRTLGVNSRTQAVVAVGRLAQAQPGARRPPPA